MEINPVVANRRFQKMKLKEILDPLPRRICTYFASQCTKDAIQRSGTKDPDVLLAQAVAERYGNGEDFDEAYLKEVANGAAASAAYSTTYSAAYYAASAAYYSATSVASAAAYSAHSAASAASAASAYYDEHYKPLLLKILNERLTPLEFVLYFGIEKESL